MKRIRFKSISVLVFGLFLLFVSFIAMIAGFSQGDITMGTVFIVLMFISLVFIGLGIFVFILSKKKEKELEEELSKKAYQYIAEKNRQDLE